MFLDFITSNLNISLVTISGPITWEMIYHPTLFLIYGYFVDTMFFISTFLTFFTAFVILKKSTKEMGYYKYILLNSLFWDYTLTIIISSYRTITLFPQFLIYSTGIFEFLPPTCFILQIYFLGFCVVGVLHSFGAALTYRVALVFPNTRFGDITSSRKDILIIYMTTFIYAETLWTSKFGKARPGRK